MFFKKEIGGPTPTWVGSSVAFSETAGPQTAVEVAVSRYGSHASTTELILFAS